jgi:purine nucleoside permease
MKRSFAFLFVVLVFGAVVGLVFLRRAKANSQTSVPIPIKVIVVANYEPGEDVGDAPGEFQFWAEREHLNEVIPIKGALRPLRRNKDGLYGIVWGNTDKLLDGATEGLMALVLDPRFDFRETYWLFTGTSGVDPRVASVGSAAWARWVVNGDTLREFDDRQIPQAWPYGLFAIGASQPNQLPNDPHSYSGMTSANTLSAVYDLNQGLARWAFNMTRSTPIPDAPQLAESRKLWTGFPNAQRPPFVLMGETLGSLRYWHGSRRTKWAEDWVRLWTHGQGVFTMTNSESQQMASGMNVLAKAGLVDLNRVMVLRTASNTSEPPPGIPPASTIGDEGPGQITAYEANYRVGAPVVHELLRNWSKYQNKIPTAP